MTTGPTLVPESPPLQRQPRVSQPLVLVPPAVSPEPEPNCWLAPGFELGMIQDLSRQVNGSGGRIEQTFLYLDPMSALDWCGIAQQEDYGAIMGVPLDRAAQQIAQSARHRGTTPLDILALGCGDGRREVRLASELLGQGGMDLRLYLLDISQPLLSEAFKYAAETLLPGLRPIKVTAVNGNFHHLPSYIRPRSPAPVGPILPLDPGRTRLVALMGGTMGNLENEVLFVRHTLGCLLPGDLFLLHVGLSCCPGAPDPQEIQRKDPRLSGRISPQIVARYERFLRGPFLRYNRETVKVDFSYRLDTTGCTVPKSYAIAMDATVTLTGGEVRRFTTFQTKRYHMLALVRAVEAEGWTPVDGWTHGVAAEGAGSLVYLFQKAGRPASGDRRAEP